MIPAYTSIGSLRDHVSVNLLATNDDERSMILAFIYCHTACIHRSILLLVMIIRSLSCMSIMNERTCMILLYKR